VEQYVVREGVEEGVENRGRRFIRWVFSRRLGTNQTPCIIEKFRQRIHSEFYMCYIYAYVIVNIKTGLKMVYYKQYRGSPWMNVFANAETLLNAQETERLNTDNIECRTPNGVCKVF